MTDRELERLSRKAAKKLPTNWLDNTNEGIRAPYHNYILVKDLARNTEACTEIYVKVLMPRRVDIEWVAAGEIYASRRPDNKGTPPGVIIARVRDVDEMQAFRTVVLLALVEVMG